MEKDFTFNQTSLKNSLKIPSKYIGGGGEIEMIRHVVFGWWRFLLNISYDVSFRRRFFCEFIDFKFTAMFLISILSFLCSMYNNWIWYWILHPHSLNR